LQERDKAQNVPTATGINILVDLKTKMQMETGNTFAQKQKKKQQDPYYL